MLFIIMEINSITNFIHYTEIVSRMSGWRGFKHPSRRSSEAQVRTLYLTMFKFKLKLTLFKLIIFKFYLYHKNY